MNRISGGVLVSLSAGLALSAGCHDRPPTYEEQRPPTDSLVDGNVGIQAKDVGAATDRMAADLLGQPALNAAQHQWTIVLTSVKNKTTDPLMSYGVFDERLKARLAQMGQGRVALIENKSTFHDLQNQELEGGGTDPYGQSGGGGQPAGIQPDYALYITVDELPNRATDYYSITGQLLNFKTRQIVWVSPIYEFQSAR